MIFVADPDSAFTLREQQILYYIAGGLSNKEIAGRVGISVNTVKYHVARIYEKMQREQEEKIASERKLQVGAGDRAERIRTYNYPQGRVTDHRIGLTLYKLEQILNGDLTELFDALNTFDQAEKLKESSGSTGGEN